jgi:hypothetical protein
VKAIVLLLAMVCAAQAHDIPNDVTIQAYLKPSGQRLLLLVRAPMSVMRDLNFPERSNGALEISKVEPFLREGASLWISDGIEIYEGDTRLPKPRVVATQLSLVSDRSFATFEQALAHVNGPPLAEDVNVSWSQTLVDVLFEYPIQSDTARFSIHPGLARLGLRVATVLRYLPPGGAVRGLEFTGDPGLVRLDPAWHQAAWQFVKMGFFHILDGTDHLLFLFCLVIPFRRFRALVPVVTAFTAAHSITLIASAYNLAPDALWFPPLIETLIAASIVYMALENIAGAGSVQRRWMVAFGFGLVHGFGFSFALRETLQFAGSYLLTSLLSFNVGVELGQLLVLAILIPVLELFFRKAVTERMGTIILSALVAHTGWHWMMERWDRFRQYRFDWPAMDATALANVSLLMLIVVTGLGAVWLVTERLRRRSPLPQRTHPPDPESGELL